MAEINKKRLLINKLRRLSLDFSIRNDEDRKVKCPVCGKEIKPENKLDDVEYVKTKRGTEIFIHTECVGNWSK